MIFFNVTCFWIYAIHNIVTGKLHFHLSLHYAIVC